LYVAPWNKTELATVATTSFLLSVVGPFGPESIAGAELSGTGDGRLFAFYSTGDPRTGLNSAVAQIDPTSATVLANNDLNSLPQGAGWAFAFWGGSFYLFTAPISRGTAETMVTRFNPADLSQTTVATFGGMGAGSSQVIVGAGVSTCAPMQ
jgi:hypothetical protein